MPSLNYFFKALLPIFVVIFSFQFTKAQTAVKLRSTFGISGSSKTFTTPEKQYIIQQSIGQSSVIGINQSSNLSLRQGFIQPHQASVKNITADELQASISPNPFSTTVTISITENISSDLHVSLCDLTGRTVFVNTFEPSQEITLNLSSLVQGLYIIKVSTNEKSFGSKLIKK